MIDLPLLKESLALSVLNKTGNPRTASIAYSSSGKTYRAGKVESQNHILDFPSELCALTLSAANLDFGVERIVSISEEHKPGEAASPLVLKILIDHATRTGKPIAYSIVDMGGKIVFETKDVFTTFPFYQPERKTLAKITQQKVSPNHNSLENVDPKVLRQYATLGLERAFLTKDDGTQYGCCAVTADKKVFFTGQYSSFDHRSNVHAEMAAIITALMNTPSPITHLGLISSKHTDTTCEMCGICRQFLQEISDILKYNLQIFTFAKDSDEFHSYSLAEYLPSNWSNQNVPLTP